MIWLGDRRGHATYWTTQLWVAATGQTASLADHPWLAGPVGDTRRIGGDCFREIAMREGLSVHADRIGPRYDLRGAYTFKVGVGMGKAGNFQGCAAEVRQCLQQAGLL